MVKDLRLLLTCWISHAKHKVPSFGLYSYLACSGAYLAHLCKSLCARHAASRMWSHGAGKNRVIAWLHREVCLSLHMFSGSSLLPEAVPCLLPCRQYPTCQAWTLPRSIWHSCSWAYFCSTINVRYLGTRGKEAVSRLANLSKVCLWYSSLVSVWLLSSRACLVSVFLVSWTDGLYCWLSFTNMLMLCWDKRQQLKLTGLAQVFHPVLFCDGTFGLFLCCSVSKTSDKLSPLQTQGCRPALIRRHQHLFCIAKDYVAPNAAKSKLSFHL